VPHPLDFAYYAALAVASPYWLVASRARAKVLGALRERMGKDLGAGGPAESARGTTTVLLHAVSVGEINATRTLAAELLSRRADVRLVVTSTSNTGHTRAVELYGGNPRITVARYPLDFSGAIHRFLDHYRPDVVVLLELEMWPNFLRICRQRELPVLLVNGRLTRHSLRRYRLIAPLARRMLRTPALLCVQDEVYAERFVQVGAPRDRIAVTGTMKFDTAALSVDGAKVEALRVAMGLQPGEPLLVAGSTGPGEEAILLRIYRQLLREHPSLRLAIVPRKPERFDEVAQLIEREGFALLRRSTGKGEGAGAGAGGPVLLGDTMGELRLFYALATVVFVGRTIVDLGPKLHGSDMLEPAALAKATIVGPYTGNFADAMHLLRRREAIVEVENEGALLAALRDLLRHPEKAERLGQAAAATITQGQGATARHADRIINLLPPPS